MTAATQTSQTASFNLGARPLGEYTLVAPLELQGLDLGSAVAETAVYTQDQLKAWAASDKLTHAAMEELDQVEELSVDVVVEGTAAGLVDGLSYLAGAGVGKLIGDVAASAEIGEVAEVVVAGGVGANRSLRDQMRRLADRDGWELFYPRPELCTDNGAMIAYAGMLRLRAGESSTLSIEARARWNLEDLSPPPDAGDAH